MYAEGKGIEKDKNQAVQWLRKAAKSPDSKVVNLAKKKLKALGETP